MRLIADSGNFDDVIDEEGNYMRKEVTETRKSFDKDDRHGQIWMMNICRRYGPGTCKTKAHRDYCRGICRFSKDVRRGI